MEDMALQGVIQEPKITKDNLMMALKSPSGVSKVWVILEGEADVTVFSALFSEQTVSVKQALNEKGRGGSRAVEDIVSSITSELPDASVFGIRDKDYTSYHKPPYNLTDNLFVTDRKDLEMMLAEAPSVRSELTAKLPKFSELERKMMPVLRHMGYSRAYASCYNIQCDFDGIFKPSRIWDYSTHSFKKDWREYCNKSVQASLELTTEMLEGFVAERELENESDFDICRGHDYVAYLSKEMVNTATYSEEFIGNILYSKYDKSDFQKTKLYRSIKDWQVARGVKVV